jgi:hypothetical protein
LHQRLENESDHLNPEQLASLDEYLASSAQELFFPSSDEEVMRREWKGVIIRPDDNGAALVLTERGQLRLSKHGGATIQNRPDQAYAFHGIAHHIHWRWVAAAIGEWLTVGIAICFVVAGVRILRNPVRGIRMHVWCATIGMLIALAAAVTTIVADPNNPLGILGDLILTLPQTILFVYAAIVLAVLTRKDVRRYVASLKGEAPAEPSVS